MPRAGPRSVRRCSDEFKLTAVRLSQMRRNDEFLGPHHLLLALLRADSSVAQTLARHGFGVETAETHLQAVFGGNPEPADPRASPPAA